MDEKKFKKDNRPAACTLPPWAGLIPSDRRDEVLRQIKHETVMAYGYSMDECPKRMVCFSKKCIGRPLPWKSATAKPYLDELVKRHNIQNDEMFLTNCDLCPIANICKSPCAQVNDFLQRDKSKEPQLEYRDNLENIEVIPERIVSVENLIGKGLKIPWDVLTTKRKETVQKYLYQQKDFLTIAKELGYHDQSRARYEYYAALTTLSEYATMRRFLEEKGAELPKHIKDTLEAVYKDNLDITEVAQQRSVSKQAIQQRVARTIKRYKITWNTFVRKEGNKVIFNKSEVAR